VYANLWADFPLGGGMGMLDTSSSEESPTCMVCDNADPLYLGDRDAYHIHQCTDCGFYFTHPMPSSNLLSDLYNHYNSNTMYTKKARRKVARVKRRIRRYKHHATGKKFLDAGCNIGSAVQAAFELGFDAHGVDIGHDGIEIARQIHPDGKYHTGEVASMPQAWAAFDFVYCADVMEHVPDPRASSVACGSHEPRQHPLSRHTGRGSFPRASQYSDMGYGLPTVSPRLFHEEIHAPSPRPDRIRRHQV